MQFVSDPPIATKIRKMKQRVQWRSPAILQRNIDQTRFVLEDGEQDNPDFSFLVIGDTGVGPSQHQHPQRQVAEYMLEQRENCRFVLHTGDVVYLVGSSEYYPNNFIRPYREFLVGGASPDRIAYDDMVFSLPVLPVLGNHDYYDLPLLQGLLAGLTLPVRQLLKFRLDFDIGWHGSYQGKAFARAFLDCLERRKGWGELDQHLDQHYTAKTETGFCLRYQPGKFTRLPNRYYTFRYGGIDFFALDSNTFNDPLPLPETQEGEQQRRLLEKERDELERQKLQLIEESERLDPNSSDDAEHLDDLRAKIEQIDEVSRDIEKQLESHGPPTIDLEQLEWLRHRLIESWHTDEVRGRIIFFHHPPYVTEATKWHQAQTLTIRNHIRQVLDSVAEAVGDRAQGRPLVDLFLSGHAHCLEYLRTLNTGHADSHSNWIVCGGSGFSLRRQRKEGIELEENFYTEAGSQSRRVARSLLFLGRNGHGSQKRRPYSFLRVDIKAGTPPKIVLRPFVAERYQKQWFNQEIEPITL